MREIRYRAWNKQENRWATHNEQLSDVNVSASVRAPSIMTVGSDKYDLQMFTGLQDKNSVEIYEGDITSRKNWNQTVVGKVERENDGTLVLIEGEGKSYLGLFREGVEVIGNIYEHPHLLEVSE